jgi:hypothetical protein
MPDLPERHLDIQNLVGFLIEGSHLTPDAHEHLLACAECRDAMVVVAYAECAGQQPTGRCQRRQSLFREWRDAAEMYVRALADLAGAVPQSELTTLTRLADAARKLTANIRIELEEHITKHRCD